MFCKGLEQEFHACPHPHSPSPAQGPRPSPLTLTHPPAPPHLHMLLLLLLRSLHHSVFLFFFFLLFFLKPLEALKNQTPFFLPFPLSPGDGSEWQPLVAWCLFGTSYSLWFSQDVNQVVDLSRCFRGWCVVTEIFKTLFPLSTGSHNPAGQAPLFAFIFLVVGFQVGS